VGRCLRRLYAANDLDIFSAMRTGSIYFIAVALVMVFFISGVEG
jgi:hypothetical protein